MRYKKIPFEEHLSLDVHDRIKSEVGRKIVPVVVTPDGEYIQDTTVIIDRLEQRFPQPLGAQNKQRIDPLLRELGGFEGLQQTIEVPLDYINHRVVVASG